VTSPLVDDGASSMVSPRPSAGSITAAMGTTSLKEIAARQEGEGVELWLKRITSQIGRNEIANVLAERFVVLALALWVPVAHVIVGTSSTWRL
jgi:hypothetical protein